MRLDEIQAGAGGILGSAARVGLHVLSWGWAAAGVVHRSMYASGLRRAAKLPVPVISVGNLAVGGTGKTPFTAWLARGLLARGRHPGILSRGYGPRAAPPHLDLSDEGAVLDRLLQGAVPQVEDPDRRRGGRRLLFERPATDVLLLDDGFQHHRLMRDLDIVLLDATRPFGHGYLLPRGRLRESPRALARADLVVLTRTERLTDDALAPLCEAVARHTDAPMLQTRTVAGSVEAGGETRPPSWLEGRQVFAACGIGHPEAFVALLEDLGARVLGHRFLPDHATLTQLDALELAEEAAAAGAESLLITRKDAVKLIAPPPAVAILDVEMEVVSGEAALWDAVGKLVRNQTQREEGNQKQGKK